MRCIERRLTPHPLGHTYTLRPTTHNHNHRCSAQFVVPLQKKLKSDAKVMQKMEDTFKSESR